MDLLNSLSSLGLVSSLYFLTLVNSLYSLSLVNSLYFLSFVSFQIPFISSVSLASLLCPRGNKWKEVALPHPSLCLWVGARSYGFCEKEVWTHHLELTICWVTGKVREFLLSDREFSEGYSAAAASESHILAFSLLSCDAFPVLSDMEIKSPRQQKNLCSSPNVCFVLSQQWRIGYGAQEISCRIKKKTWIFMLFASTVSPCRVLYFVFMSVPLLAAFLFRLYYFTLEQNILFNQELLLRIGPSGIWEAGREDHLEFTGQPELYSRPAYAVSTQH